MLRRTFLKGITTAFIALAGCLRAGADDSGADGSTPATGRDGSSTPSTTKPTGDAAESAVRIVNIARQTCDCALMSRERVRFENIGDEPFSLDGYTVRYDSGQTYAFSDLTLQPGPGEVGAEVIVVSQGTGDGAMKRKPPIYIRDANFDSLALSDGSGTVSLVAPDGTVVAREAYDGPPSTRS